MLFHDLPQTEADQLASKLPVKLFACFAISSTEDPYQDYAYAGTLGRAIVPYCTGALTVDPNTHCICRLSSTRIRMPHSLSCRLLVQLFANESYSSLSNLQLSLIVPMRLLQILTPTAYADPHPLVFACHIAQLQATSSTIR
jgi:hypothetical protein